MIIEDDYIEIYLEDLNEESQDIFLEAMGFDSAEEGNYDVFPIATVPIPIDEDE